MGEWLVGLRVHRRAIALGAVVLLPLSTAAATASVAGSSPASVAPVAPGGLQAGLALGVRSTPVPVTNVGKALPAGWLGASGHTPVVVGTIRQRVAQVSATTSYDVPQAALEAYQRAEASVATSNPGCHLSWTLLAGIGQVESDNGRYGGAVVLSNGDTSPHILGPVLNGTGGVGAIRDTDGGRYDGDPIWDRAVGPMQFIPGTWASYGADGNADGVRDPNNIADAALGAAHYLCAGGGDLRVQADLRAAVMRYNHSVAYVDLVLRLARAYASGAATVVPNGPATAPAPPAGARQESGHQGGTAPVKPGREPGLGKVPGSGRDHGSGGSGGSGRGSGGDSGKGGGRGGSGGGGSGGGSQPPPIHTGPHRKPPTTTTPITPTPINNPGPTSPAPTSPAPTSPAPTKPPAPKPAHGKPGHSAPEPIATGALDTCAAGWCVGTSGLDFGADADLSKRQGDLNGDGKTRSLQRELRALRGLTVTVILEPLATPPAADGGTTDSTGGSAAGNGTTAPAAPEVPAAPGSTGAGTGKVEDPAPIVITVDADRVVTGINGVPYAAPGSAPDTPAP